MPCVPYQCELFVAYLFGRYPFRNCTGVFFQGYMWIMGGRAREFTALSESKRVGGVIGPRVAEISDPDGTTGQRYTTKREAIVLKSDVWRSSNGRDWELIQPGCKAPQRDLVAFGNRVDKEQGRVSEKCSSDRDCYGAEKCDLTLRTCVCQMWSSREQHAVAAYGNYMYLVRGFASALHDFISFDLRSTLSFVLLSRALCFA